MTPETRLRCIEDALDFLADECPGGYLIVLYQGALVHTWRSGVWLFTPDGKEQIVDPA